MAEALTNLIDKYISFQNQSPSPWHVVADIEKELTKHGFAESTNCTDQCPNGFVRHPQGTALVAWRLPTNPSNESVFAISAAHVDSPVLKLRSKPEINAFGSQQLLTQLHGGLIQRSWLDRPLKLAGIIHTRGQGNKPWPTIDSQLVATTKPVAVIPELAIHLDRDKNAGGEINPETMLKAVVGTGESSFEVRDFFPNVSKEIVGFDLCLAPDEPHKVVGLDDSLLCGPRHDDLAMVFATLQALTATKAHDHVIQICAFFDAEETGSVTSAGAGSSFLRDILDSIAKTLGWDNSTLAKNLRTSLVVSADMAHAYHPAHADKFDDNHRLGINQGLVIKENANDRYATTGATSAQFELLCREAEIPVQKFINRQDMLCGSTIGPVISQNLSAPTVDVGVAMHGMHSTNETMGTRDLSFACQAFAKFFQGN